MLTTRSPLLNASDPRLLPSLAQHGPKVRPPPLPSPSPALVDLELNAHRFTPTTDKFSPSDPKSWASELALMDWGAFRPTSSLGAGHSSRLSSSRSCQPTRNRPLTTFDFGFRREPDLLHEANLHRCVVQVSLRKLAKPLISNLSFDCAQSFSSTDAALAPSSLLFTNADPISSSGLV